MVEATRPSIFTSYCHSDKTCAAQIEGDLEVLGMDIVRDERSLRYTDDLPSYMKRIRSTDFALVLVSDAFLKSSGCMNEILEFFKDDDHSERILPVIIPDYTEQGIFHQGARISDPVHIAEYVGWWENRLKALRASARGIDIAHAAEISQEVKHTTRICAVIGEFLSLLRRIKYVKFPDLLSSGYHDLLLKLGLGSITINDIRRARSLYSQATSEKTCEGRLRFLDRALTIFPAFPEALNKRGQVLDELQRYEDALLDYGRAISAAPFRAAAYISRSYAYIRLGRLQEALADVNSALELEPNHKEGYNNRADILRRLGRYQEARQDIDRALAIDPDFDLAYATHAEVCLAEGNISRFYELLAKAVDHGFPVHKYSFDAIYATVKNDTRFVELIQKSASVNTRFI